MENDNIRSIKCLEDLSGLTSHQWVKIACCKCGIVNECEVYALRYRFKHKRSSYVCHHCAVKESAPENSIKIKLRAKQKAEQQGRVLYADFSTVKCSICSCEFKVKYRNIKANIRRNNGIYRCKSCSLKLAHKNHKFDKIYDDKFKEKLSLSSKNFWDEARGTWREKLVTPEFIAKMSEYGKKAWTEEFRRKFEEKLTSPEYKEKLSEWSKMAWTNKFRDNFSKRMKELWSDPIFREKMINIFRENSTKLWEDPEYVHKTILAIKELWSDPQYREKMAVVRINQPKTSTQQRILYSFLDDLKVKYFDDSSMECKIGYYTFDCRIDPQPNIKLSKPLLIEVQGDYWHGLPKAVAKDKSKSTYIRTYFPEFDLKYLWEHEFDNKDRIVNLLKYWLGLRDQELVRFDFKQVTERVIDYKEAELFVSKYHYAGRVGRSGVNLGYFVDDELVAVIVYSFPVRQEVALKQGLAYREVLELSRLAIHPSYQVKNLASHLIGRSINYIRKNHKGIKLLVSFADSSHNHFGTIYRASNWTLDGEVKPDYWYADDRGYICHKKTLWNKARKNSLTEGEYCLRHNYQKIWGDRKFRFVFSLI